MLIMLSRIEPAAIEFLDAGNSGSGQLSAQADVIVDFENKIFRKHRYANPSADWSSKEHELLKALQHFVLSSNGHVLLNDLDFSRELFADKYPNGVEWSIDLSASAAMRDNRSPWEQLVDAWDEYPYKDALKFIKI